MRIHSLRAKLMLLFFIFFFVPYSLIVFFSVSMSRGMMKKSTMDHLSNLVEIKETAIEQWLRERISDGKTIAETHEIRSMELKRIGPFLSLVKHLERSYIDIVVLSSSGQSVSESISGKSFGDEEWFQTAMRNGEFIAGPTLQTKSHRPAISICLSVRDEKARPIGVLKESVDLRYVADLLAESKLGETGKFFIVNPRGEFLIHNRLEERLKNGRLKADYFKAGQIKAITTTVYKDYLGNEVLGSWKWIPGFQCYLIAEQDTSEAFHDIELFVRKALAIFIVSTLLILGISYWVIGRVTKPIKRLSESASSFANGHFELSISSSREDEIGKLITGFNVMAIKLKKAYTELEGKVQASNKELEIAYEMLKQRQEQLVQSEKMAALGQLSAGIAHEIRTPITSIKVFIQSLEKEMNLDENKVEDFAIIKKEIDRINGNITRFLNFARPEEPVIQPVDVSVLVKETVNLLSASFRNRGISLDTFLYENNRSVVGDPKQLAQVFLNLFLNAVEAMPDGGSLTISSVVQAEGQSRQKFLQIIVRDTGQGIPAENIPYLFDPFFTTKSEGTGLGLSIVYAIVQKHNGRIQVESTLGEGSSFILSLPLQEE